MNEQLPKLLAERLAEPLPEPASLARFRSGRPGRGPFDEAPAEARRAAVLVLLYPHEERWHLPLTLRPTHLPDHAGQVCFPGGAIEPDETSGEAARREFHEELGAPEMGIELLGRLSSLYVDVSNFCVEPWVGVSYDRGRFVPNPAEVEQLLEIPLDHLLDPANLGSHRRQWHGEAYNAPHFAWKSYRIWGATCLMLGQLVTIVQDIGA